MRIEPEIGGCSIVILGYFNPAIFAPQWFAKYDIVSQTEADNAQLSLMVPDFVNFKLGSKAIVVDPSRFSVETAEAPWVAICDLTVKTFAEFLPHTPLFKLGINRQVHFGVGNEELRNRIGRLLAPTEPWGEWGAKIRESPKELRGGFTSLTMQETWKQGDYRGHYQAKIEPSLQLGGASGIFVQVNHHCEPLEFKEGDGAEKIVRFLIENFSQSLRYSEWIIDQIMKLKEDVG
ncbi:MAG: hypothetical protein ABR929_05590 [Roseiarcus sp.]